jgi:hypothetical protein
MYNVVYSTLNVQCTAQYTKCTLHYTVHIIITLFNIGNVLLYTIHQLNFTYLCMLNEYHVIYIEFFILRGLT